MCLAIHLAEDGTRMEGLQGGFVISDIVLVCDDPTQFCMRIEFAQSIFRLYNPAGLSFRGNARGLDQQ